jgi:DNA-binding beta-propeller fold protein YncE
MTNMHSDENIKNRLDRSLRIVEPPPSRVDAVIARGRRLRLRSRAGRGTLALVAIAAVAGPLTLLYPLGDHPEDRTGLEPGRLVVETQLRLDPGITDVAVGAEGVWVTGGGGVTRIDPATNQVLAQIPVSGAGDRSRIAIGEGSVWVTAPELRDDGSRGNLVRIDPATNEIEETFHIGGPITGVGIGGGSVWVTIPGIGPGHLLAIDPATGEVLHRLRVGESPGSPVYGYGFMWVDSTDSLTKVDPVTGSVIDELPGPNVESSGDGSLWGVDDDSVIRFDPDAGTIEATVAIPRAAAVSMEGGTVWVLVFPRSSDPALFYPVRGTAAVERIDPATNELVGEPLPLDDLQPIGISADGDRLWVADFNSGSLTRIVIRPG